jgi:DNA-binding NtrC family response regulator
MASILVCDEEVATVNTLRDAFTDIGHSVTVVNDIVDAVRIVYPSRFQALFIGVDMQRANEARSRVAALRVLRAIDPELPVVILAHGNSLEIERQVRLEGIFCLCLKPIDALEAMDVLTNVLQAEGASLR